MKTKQIAIISGKGGTGKTTLAGSLGVLFNNHIIADCDVDASNLQLILKPKTLKTFQYKAGHKAQINENKCIGCGNCEQVCRYSAIYKRETDKYRVDPFACVKGGFKSIILQINRLQILYFW